MTEESGNMAIWKKLYRPPVDALKKITGGRLSGMTDIRPQWRYEALTELFGPCGVGWKFNVVERWSECGPDGIIMVFVKINLYYKYESEWSDSIEGNGGATLVAKEKAGLHCNDEAYKMAVTDAIGTAAKMIGVGGAIYAGKFDGSKYTDEPQKKQLITDDQVVKIKDFLTHDNCNEGDLLTWAGVDKVEAIPESKFNLAIAGLTKRCT